VKAVKIDLGPCPNWTLQIAWAEDTTFVRCLSAEEVAQIKVAVSFCRKYATMPTYRLLNSSYAVWCQTFGLAISAERRQWHPGLAENLQGAFVGWLLVWRLVLDQSEHDLSSRFGSDSEQFKAFGKARKEAYDSSRAYRVVEALRNLVQHRVMPSLNLKRAEYLDKTTGETVRQVSYRFPVSDLLSSSKCPATIKKEFGANPDLVIDLPATIGEAMTAIRQVLLELVKISIPELIVHVQTLKPIFEETHGLPMLLRAKPPAAGAVAGGLDFEMAALHDLQLLVMKSPLSPAPTAQSS
jgi:hypothetical protein